MKDAGATKVLVLGNFKDTGEYAKAIFDATEGNIISN